MRKNFLTILIAASLLPSLKAAGQNQPVPGAATTRFLNIRASLEDGFFSLAEQQARGILRAAESSAAEKHEAALLLVQALWGQKRFSEMLELLRDYDGEPGYVYWRARAHFELKQFDKALLVLEGAKGLDQSRYAPFTLRLQARMLLVTGKLKEAEAAYRQFAEEFPEHAERIANQFDLAEACILQKRIPEAIAVYEVLTTEKAPATAQRAQLKLANLLYTRGAAESFGVARELLAGIATNQQARLAYRIDAYVDLAALEEKAARKPEAVESLRKAIALSPDAHQRVPLKLSLARLLLREDQVAGALKLLEECRAEAPNVTVAAELQLEKAGALLQAQQFEAADEAYQVYLDVADDPAGMAQAYFGKGIVLLELERYAEAAAALDKAAKGLQDERRADALVKAADAFYLVGKFEDAEKRYRSFIVDFPQHENVPNALYQLGLAQARTSRRADALATFQRLEQEYAQTPFAEKAALRAADVMLASQQFEPALEKLAQIGQTYTNSTAAFSLHKRGIVLYENLGRYAAAQQAFESVIAGHPESEYVPQAFLMRGFCLARQGAVQDAVEVCKEFIEKYPESELAPEAVFWLAEQYFNQGNYAAAEPLFLRVCTDFKEDGLAPRALYWAGRCAAAQSNYVKAFDRYSEVAKSYPDSEILPQTRFAQGDVLTELGEFTRAILAFEEIIKNYPGHDLVNAAWGRKGGCQFTLAVDEPARYAEAINSYQVILDRPSAPVSLKLEAEYWVGRCLEKTNVPDKAFGRYMNVVYTFINEDVERSPYSVMWFTRSAFDAATLKEKEQAWVEAVQIYERVVAASVPAGDEAIKRIEKIRKENWLLFQQAEERN